MPKLILHETFELTLQNVLDKHAPPTTRVRTVRPLSPWYNDEIKEARRIRRRYERKWQKHDNEENRKAYKEQHITVNRLIRKAKESYYNEQLAAADSKRVFQIINKLLNKGAKALPSCDSYKELSDSLSMMLATSVRWHMC